MESDSPSIKELSMISSNALLSLYDVFAVLNEVQDALNPKLNKDITNTITEYTQDNQDNLGGGSSNEYYKRKYHKYKQKYLQASKSNSIIF